MYTSQGIELAFTPLTYHFLFGNPPALLSIPFEIRFFLRASYYRKVSFPAKYSVGGAPNAMRSHLDGDMYIRAHTEGGKCHYCVLAKSWSTCSRNAKSLLLFSIDSITRRSGNLMRLISVSVGRGGQQRENTFTITLAEIKPGLIESTFSTFNLRKAMVYRFGLFNNSCQAREYKLSFAARGSDRKSGIGKKKGPTQSDISRLPLESILPKSYPPILFFFCLLYEISSSRI